MRSQQTDAQIPGGAGDCHRENILPQWHTHWKYFSEILIHIDMKAELLQIVYQSHDVNPLFHHISKMLWWLQRPFEYSAVMFKIPVWGDWRFVIWFIILLKAAVVRKGWTWSATRLSALFVLKGPKCANKHTTLHHNQPEPLIRGRLDWGCHVVYAKVWQSYNPYVAAENENH